MAIWKVYMRVGRLPYFHVLPTCQKRHWNSLKLSIPMTSTSDELWATSNPRGHGDLSLNRPEIETIEEAFSCEPWSHKDTSDMPIHGSFIPKEAVEKHVLTCHFHPFFSLYWCKFGSFSLASLSCRCFYVGLKVDRGQKGLKGCFFSQRWLKNLNLQSSASKNSPSFSDDQHTFCIILYDFVHFREVGAMLRFCRSCAEICTWRRPATVQWLLGPCQPCGRPGLNWNQGRVFCF